MKTLVGVGAVVALVVGASLAWAGPIEDARALVAQKKYDQVDKALEKELAARPPNADALRISLEAALASGRIVTADRRLNDLLRQVQNADLELVVQGAVLAGINGDSRTALTRYLAYARGVDAKSDKLDAAFTYVLLREAYPDEFKKYVKTFGATDKGWLLGTKLLGRLVEVPDAAKALEIAEFLMQTWPEPQRVAWVHGTLKAAADSFALGKEPKDRWVRTAMLMAKYAPSDYIHLWTIQQANGGAFSPAEKVQLFLEIQAHAKQPLENLLGLMDAARDLPTDDAKIEAARKYLPLEALYKASPNPADYERFVRVIVDSPQVFAIKDKAVVSPAQMQAMVDALIAKAGPTDPGRLWQVAPGAADRYTADPAAKAAFCRRIVPYLDSQRIGEMLATTKGQDLDAVLAEVGKAKGYGGLIDLHQFSLGVYVTLKAKDRLINACREMMLARPASFDAGQVREKLMGGDLAAVDEKLALLEEVVGKVGWSPAMDNLLKEMANDKKTFGDNPRFQALKKNHDARPQGSDILARTCVALQTTNDGNAANQAVAKFLAEYKGPLVADARKATNLQEYLAWSILRRNIELAWNDRGQSCTLALQWAPRLPLGDVWREITERINGHQARDVLLKLAPFYIALTGGAEKGSPAVWSALSNATLPKNSTVSPFTERYGPMGESAFGFILNNQDNWAKPQVELDEIAKVTALPGVKLTSSWAIGRLNDLLFNTASKDLKPAPAVVKLMWDGYLANIQKTPAYELQLEAYTYGQYLKSERLPEADAFLAAYIELLKKRTLPQQIEALSWLVDHACPPAEKEKEPPAPGRKMFVVLKVLKPLYEQVALPDASVVTVNTHVMNEVSTYARTLPDGDLKNQALAMAHTMTRLVLAGAKLDREHSYAFGVFDLVLRDHVAKGNWVDAQRTMALQGDTLGRGQNNWNDTLRDVVAPVVKLLDDAKLYEPEFAFITAVEKRGHPDESVAKSLAILKAKAAQQIPDLISVPPTDPSYDLHQAARALALGNDARAWELTAPKWPMLPKIWESLDTEYVVWSIDQMRKQKLLKESLEYAMTVLLREKELDAETAAAVLLTRGSIYQDMGNFQAARIEYEGLRANARYAKTEAGGKAQYRLIQLMLLTKDFTSAEALLERLSMSDNVNTQAEAFFLYARMTYLQGDYKESKEYLKKVRERVMNHAEASLLEGELNLLLPGGLQNTEVTVGDPKLSKIAIPGRVLTLKLQDPNLSVARGGAAIPVVITTSKGGDEEHIKLLPSASNKNLFVGQIASALGKVAKNNMQLELRGDDIVSYQIEPEFQKLNDLSYPPKTLEVRADARLVASSGEILTEEEEEKKALQAQLNRNPDMESRRLDIGRDGRTIRPGSPIYVQVTDFAQDLSDEPDKVVINLKTGSGESLEGFPLVETGPHTGLFRAAVPTGMPAPRAFASDTEEGKTPSSAISAAKPAPWKSVEDGKKPKWFEADTMTSHELASMVAEIPGLANLKEFTVLGMLADDYEEIASFPPTTETALGGVRVEYTGEGTGDQLLDIQRILKVAPTTTYTQDGVLFNRDQTPLKGKDGWLACRMTGAFWLAEGRTLELKFLQPPSRDNWQHAYLVVDGQPILGGTISDQSVKATAKIDLIKGPHKLEVYVKDHWSKSTVSVGYRKDDGTFEPMPDSWFSVKDHPELGDFLKPKGKIAIAGDTLTVTMDQPRRMRKLRILFKAFTGAGVSVKSVTVKDAAGGTVIPRAEEAAAAAKRELRISPGDQILVTYDDLRRLREDTPTLTAKLNSSYYNGTIVLANEMIVGTGGPNDPRKTEYYPARRCRAGDQLMVVVTDYDEDTTDERDTVEVHVSTTSGEKLTLKSLETAPNASDDRQKHAGQFLAILKIGTETKGDTVKVVQGDRVTVSYLDKENTKPGVPIERSFSIDEAGRGEPKFLVYRTTMKQVEDKSPEAEAKRKAVRAKEHKEVVLYRDQIVARHPDYEPPPDPNAPKPAPKPETPKAEAPKPEATKTAPKADGAKGEAGTAGAATEAGKAEAPKAEPGKEGPAKAEKPKAEARKGDLSKADLEKLEADKSEGAPVNALAPLLFEIEYARMALNSGSTFDVIAVADSEIRAARRENREAATLKVPVYLDPIDHLSSVKGYPVQLMSHIRRDRPNMLREGVFAGVVRFQIGKHGDPIDDLVTTGEKEFASASERQSEQGGFLYRVPTLIVSGNDVVHLVVKNAETGKIVDQKVRLLNDARLEIMDDTYTIRTDAIHLGEKFYIKLVDPDHDRTDERDVVDVQVKATSGDTVTMKLTETLPHSGVFTGSLQPIFIGEKNKPAPAAGAAEKEPGKAAPAAKPAPVPGAKGEAGDKGAAPAAKDAPAKPAKEGPAAPAKEGPPAPAKEAAPPAKPDAIVYVNFGDEITFTFVDDMPLSCAPPLTVTASAKIHLGADAELAVFTKRFKDPEMAVKTRFLMAEALFEMAKEHRKLKAVERADEEIARGKRVLEEALRDYPDTALAVQGEFLLANLAQELGNFQEAIGRYSHVIAGWSDSEYAPISQFRKAVCFEKMSNYDQACEDYVKVTYIYPESPLVADATIRLGNYYYKKEAYKVAGKIFFNFQQKNPQHKLAPEALFLAAQCYYKLNDMPEAIRLFDMITKDYPNEKDVRAEAMYWLADSYFKANDHRKSYQNFMKLTYDYPESKWAKIARGRLTEEVFTNLKEEQ